MKQLDDAKAAQEAAAAKYAADLKAQQDAAAKAQEAAVAAALKADAEKRAAMIAAPTMGQQPAPAQGNTAADMLKSIAQEQAPQPAQPPAPRVQDAQSLSAMSGLQASPVSQLMGGTASTTAAKAPTAAQQITAGPGFSALDSSYLKDLTSMDPRWFSKKGEENKTQQPRTTGQEPAMVGMPSPESTTPSYSSRGVGAVGDIGSIPVSGNLAMPMFGNQQKSSASSPSNYFAMMQPGQQGISPGTTALGSPDMPLYGAMPTMNALGSNKNLSPTMLGGQQNAGYTTDRMGNRIYAPGAMPLFGYAKGGDIDVAALMAQNTETLSDETPEEVINTDPIGTAQKYLEDMSGQQDQTTYSLSPKAIAVKRVRSSSSPSGSAKEMAMQYESLSKEDLGAMKDLKPKAKDGDSARAQLEELARQYKMKIRAVENRARGLASDTFGAPTLESPSLMKNSLAKKRFAEGGEAKKPEAEEGEPSLFGVSDYATRASERMFPGQMGQDDQRDAARHMLAAGMVARKYGPGTAEFLGKAHERLNSPASFFNMFGIGEPRDDYAMDVHNNQLGAELAARSKTQAELEKLVAAMAAQSQNKQVKGKPWTMSREQMQARKNKGMTPPPEYRAEGSPEEGETSLKDQLIGAGETALTLGSGAVSSLVGMPYGLYKGLTSGRYLEGKAPEIADKEAAAFIERNTYVPRSETGRSNLEALGKLMEKSKLPPVMPEALMLSSIPRAAVASQVERAGMAAEKALEKPVNKILDKGGVSAELLKSFSASPAYAVRPTGSTMMSGPMGFDKAASKVDETLNFGFRDARSFAGEDQDKVAAMQDFWNKKARNYFIRQFGTPDDPVANAIAKKQIKGMTLEEVFPEYLLDQLSVGKTRVNEQGQERFFPKYPRAMEDFTKRYDEATGLRGNLVLQGAGNPEYEYLLSDKAHAAGRAASDAQVDKLLSQGLRPELINPNVGVVTRSAKNPERVIGDGTDSAKNLLGAYEEARAYSMMTPAEQERWANTQFGNGRPLQGLEQSQVGENIMPQNVRTAIERGEPVYDIGTMGQPLKKLLDPHNINRFLATVPTREIANMRFEDAVRGAAKLTDNADRNKIIIERIKSGKPVADNVFSQGVSAPIMQIKEGPLEGFAWKRIEKREATVPEGAYVGHSVGGYEMGGATYTTDKREGFNTGKWQIYTLRDNRNRPVNTVEVKMVDENTPVVTQIKGNGRATGNVPAEKYDTAVLEFLQKHLKPAAIEESNTYLTPLLQEYKQQLGPSPRMR